MTSQTGNPTDDKMHPFTAFISYSRSDAAFADKLLSALEMRRIAVSIDKRNLPTLEDWRRELLGLIRSADAVVFIISKRSVSSAICIWELEECAKLNKRLAPIRLESVPDSDVPPTALQVNHLSFERLDDFDVKADELAQWLLTDRAWVKEHTRLQAMADRWNERGRTSAVLLRGQELQEAERWIASRPQEAPLPTFLHRQLIEESRRAATRRQRTAVAGSFAVTGIALSLAALAYWQRENAVRNEREATAQRDQALIAQSRFLADVAHQQSAAGDAATGMALALEGLPNAGSAGKRPYVPEAELSLYESLISLTEVAVLAHKVTVGGMSWSGPDGVGQDVATHDQMIQYALDQLPTAAHMFASMGGVRAVFSRDGSTVATWGNDGARVWEANTGRELAHLHPRELGIDAAAISPNGSRLVTAFPDQAVYIWSTADWSELAVLRGHSALLTTVGFSPDGSRIITGSWDNTVRLWNASTGHQERVLTGHGAGVNIAFFSRNGSRIVTGSGDKTVRLWDASTGELLAVFSGHSESILNAQMSPDGRLIATTANDGTARLWDAGSGALIRYLAHDDAVGVDFSLDGTRVVIASKTGLAKIVEVGTGVEIAVLRGHSRSVLSATYSPDGAQVVTASNDGSARLWDSQTGKELREFRGHERGLFGAIFSPNGKIIATMSFDGTARLWQSSFGKFVSTYKGDTDADNSPQRNPNGGRLLKIEGDHTVRVVDPQTEAELAVLKGHKGTIFSAAFNADGSRVVTASYDATARVWDSGSGRELGVLVGHQGSVLNAAFSPDGERVATGSSDRTVRIWDLKTLATLAVAKAGYEVHHVGFSSDGTKLIAAGRTGESEVWPFFPNTQSLVDFAQASIPRCLTREQRQHFFLEREPPRWCIRGVDGKNAVVSSRWNGKWPYQTRE